MSTCRICKEYDSQLTKYSTRHYVHAKCGIDTWGKDFIHKLNVRQLRELPYFTLKDAGLLEYVQSICALHPEKEIKT